MSQISMNALKNLVTLMLFAITLMVRMSVSAMMDMLAMELSVKVYVSFILMFCMVSGLRLPFFLPSIHFLIVVCACVSMCS